MYQPTQLFHTYTNLAHGKTKISAIHKAVRQADENNDIPYQIFFRTELCEESCFYHDGLEMILVFPELLALADKYPNAPIAKEADYANIETKILWLYKWFLMDAISFYQVCREDIEHFLEDFKQRRLSAGCQLQYYYRQKYRFLKQAKEPSADTYFHLFETAPFDRNADCKACVQTTRIEYYLAHDAFETAARLAKDLETGKLSCADGSSWFRLNKIYLNYYLQKKDYETAQTYIQAIKKHVTPRTEFNITNLELLCYSHLNITKALRIYKMNWKVWLLEKNPLLSYKNGLSCCLFFEILRKNRKRQTIKISSYNTAFPLYRETNTYTLTELYDYYYKFTKNLAQKFDARNKTNYYMETLEQSLNAET